MLENGDNGLLTPWHGQSVFVNPPYSDVLPWTRKSVEAEAFCFLVNVDPSTIWWRELTLWGNHMFAFRYRLAFIPPPGVEVSSNDRSQCLICDNTFRSMIGNSFGGEGQWWTASV